MIQRIHIFGATGSGTTTLGKALAKKMGYIHFDNDNYVFETDGKQFTKPRRPIIRNTLLYNDLRNTPSWVLSGAVCGWGDFIIRYLDLVVFLWVPLDDRLIRIEAREEKLGRKKHKTYKKFIRWASAYDTGSTNMRSLAQHEEWMKKLSCPLLRLEGNKSLDEDLKTILKHIKLIEKAQN